jgi:spore coat protein A
MPPTLRPVAKLPESAAVTTRMLTLIEYDDYVGNSMVMLLNGSHWSDPITEQPILDSVEIWNLINLTEDAHPIHLHLVRFQILDRRPFDVFDYQQHRTLRYLAPATQPAANEAGWKDTVRADPGVVTRIITKFEGFAGRYVWHCHLLEHEDNEMMRPYEVVTSASERVATFTPPEIPKCIGGIARR